MDFYEWLDSGRMKLILCRFSGGKVWAAWLSDSPEGRPIACASGGGLTEAGAIADLVGKISGTQLHLPPEWPEFKVKRVDVPSGLTVKEQ